MDLGTLLVLLFAKLEASIVAAVYEASNPAVAQLDPKDPVRVGRFANAFDSILSNDLSARTPLLLDGKTYGPLPKGFELAGASPGGVDISGILSKLAALEGIVKTLTGGAGIPIPTAKP